MLESHYIMFRHWKRNGLKIVPREIENNASAKLWRAAKSIFIGSFEKRPIQTLKASKVIKARLLLLSKKNTLVD